MRTAHDFFVKDSTNMSVSFF